MLAPNPVRNVNLAVAVALDGRPKYIIAATSGIPGTTFSGILSGRVTPSAAQRAGLAQTLGTTEADLFPEAIQ